MHRIYTSDRGDTSSTISRTKYRVRACADITRERGHLTRYETEVGHWTVVFQQISIQTRLLEGWLSYAILKQFGKLPSLSE